jgi:transcriptional regulator with XRE-family HTH domain
MEGNSQITRTYFKYVLRRYRLRAELSQEQLSGLLGVSRGFYSLLELGKKWPNVDMLIRIAWVLGVGPGEILDAMVEEAKRDSCRKVPPA